MKWPALVGLGAVLGILLGWALWGRGKPPVIGEATLTQIDSLRASQAAYDSLQRAVAESAVTVRTRQAQTEARAAALTRAATVAGHRADSLAAVAARFPIPLTDSAAIYYRDAYGERSREADSLRISNALGLSAMRQAQNFANLCLLAQKEAEGRMSQLQGVNDDLQAVIAAARAPSRLQFGLYGGYGATVSGGQVALGPQVGIGLAYSFRLRFPHL